VGDDAEDGQLQDDDRRVAHEYRMQSACSFACACARSVQVLVIHWRQGFSVLERPEVALDGDMRPLPTRLATEWGPRHDAGSARPVSRVHGGRVPVAIAMAGSALVYILLTGNLPPFVVVHRMISGIDSFRSSPCRFSSWPATR
jgi:hypothetical protein